MAFNTKTFFTRTGSAIIFSIIMMAGMLSNEWAFLGLFFVVNFLCLREYVQLVSHILNTPISKNEGVNFVFVGMALFLCVCSLPIHLCANEVANVIAKYMFHLIGLFIGALIMFFVFLKNKRAFYLLSGLGYISLSLGLLVQLRYQSLMLPLALILLIWMNDSMAYIVGSFIGKTPFFPAISPKKTWEGTIGGALFAMALAGIWGYYSNAFTILHWIGLGLIASVVGTIGDLIESKLKRMAGVKDSGSMMPGHGGALDRFDSLLLASPFAFLFALLFMACLSVKVF